MIGSRSITRHTPVPILSVLVAAAAAVSAINGSSVCENWGDSSRIPEEGTVSREVGMCVCSATSNDSKPWASVARANSSNRIEKSAGKNDSPYFTANLLSRLSLGSSQKEAGSAVEGRDADPLRQRCDGSQNLALPRVRCFLDRVQKLMAVDGQIEIGTGGLSSADPLGHVHEKLRNVEGRAGGRRRWNPAIARGYREVGQRLAPLRTAQTQFGVLDAYFLFRVGGRDREVAVRA